MKEKTIKQQLMADLLLIFQLEHREEGRMKIKLMSKKDIFQYLKAIRIEFLC